MNKERSPYIEIGKFTPSGDCFEMYNQPVRRWRNSLYNHFGEYRFNSVIEDLGDGITCLHLPDGETVQIVPHEGKYLYVRDDETNLTFCPGGDPLLTSVEDYWHRIRSVSSEIHCICDGLELTQRIFVPKNYNMEVWTATVTNHSDQNRVLSLFAYAKTALGYHYTTVVPEIQGVFAYRYNSANQEKDPHKAFLCTLNNYHAATGTRECFLKRAYNASSPRIVDGIDLDNQSGHEYYAMAAVQSKIELTPGETKRIDFLLGHAMSIDEIHRIREACSPEALDDMLEEQVTIERNRADRYSVDLGIPDLNALINNFSKKQLYSYLINKSGYRDNLQVVMALCMCDIETSEDVIRKALSFQHSEGWAPHYYRPLQNRRSSDNHAWILIVVPWVIKETGNLDLLDEVLPFQNGSEVTSIWDHMIRAMRFLANDTGKNGLCDLREGDWNDGLTPMEPSPEGRESVMVTEQFCCGLLEMIELAELRGDTQIAEEAKDLHKTFSERINRSAWDGNWYQRVICSDGFVIGSSKSKEGKIFQNSQSWAVLGKVAPKDRLLRCMDAVEEHLKLDIGYRVCFPPFTDYDARVGHSSTMPPGNIENGGCYNHAAGFKLIADCMLKRPEVAWETFRKIAPGNPQNPPARSGAEPFAFVNMYRAHEYVYGESLYAWNTGTAAWMVMGLIEWILGARRSHAGLLIDPCLSKNITHAKLFRTFRGASYSIVIDNSAGRCCGVTKINFNQKPIEGNLLPTLKSGHHEVEVII